MKNGDKTKEFRHEKQEKTIPRIRDLRAVEMRLRSRHMIANHTKGGDIKKGNQEKCKPRNRK